MAAVEERRRVGWLMVIVARLYGGLGGGLRLIVFEHDDLALRRPRQSQGQESDDIVLIEGRAKNYERDSAAATARPPSSIFLPRVRSSRELRLKRMHHVNGS